VYWPDAGTIDAKYTLLSPVAFGTLSAFAETSPLIWASTYALFTNCWPISSVDVKTESVCVATASVLNKYLLIVEVLVVDPNLGDSTEFVLIETSVFVPVTVKAPGLRVVIVYVALVGFATFIVLVAYILLAITVSVFSIFNPSYVTVPTVHVPKVAPLTTSPLPVEVTGNSSYFAQLGTSIESTVDMYGKSL